MFHLTIPEFVVICVGGACRKEGIEVYRWL